MCEVQECEVQEYEVRGAGNEDNDNVFLKILT